MNLPKIELTSPPDLAVLTGLFGGLADGFQATYSDDRISDPLAYLYEVMPPQGRF